MGTGCICGVFVFVFVAISPKPPWWHYGWFHDRRKERPAVQVVKGQVDFAVELRRTGVTTGTSLHVNHHASQPPGPTFANVLFWNTFVGQVFKAVITTSVWTGDSFVKSSQRSETAKDFAGSGKKDKRHCSENCIFGFTIFWIWKDLQRMCKINQISIVHKKVIIATLCVFAQFWVRFCAEIETREPNFSELTYFIQIHIYIYAFVTIANMYLSYL